jgi:hypothetical protein
VNEYKIEELATQQLFRLLRTKFWKTFLKFFGGGRGKREKLCRRGAESQREKAKAPTRPAGPFAFSLCDSAPLRQSFSLFPLQPPELSP